jgi:ABC-type nitrate/sulfonate/bicarbonate transport system substrate-binding protein
LRAQGLRKVSFTLPWVAQGSTLYPQVAQQKGFWRQRGLDVDIVRGYGSFPAIQAIAAGQIDCGISQFPSLAIGVAKDLPVTGLAVFTYSLAWAIAVRGDSPIQKPADLAGKLVGGAATASDFIFLTEYLRRTGVDPDSIKRVQLDSKIIEQAAINRQVDAITAVVSSTAPVFLSQNTPVRFLQYASVDLDAVGHVLVARKQLVDSDPALITALTDGLVDAVAFVMRNPAESLDLFAQAVPEIDLTASGRDFARAGLGTFYHLAVGQPLRDHGIGAWDDAKLASDIDLVIANLTEPGTRKPRPAEVLTAGFAGKVKLHDGDWAKIAKAGAPYDALFQENKA